MLNTNMRTNEEVSKIIELKNTGKNNTEIAKLLGIPRTTIISIIKNFDREKIDKRKKIWINDPITYIVGNNLEKEYSYLLGLYLGDGHISQLKRTQRIRFFLDSKYDSLNDYVNKSLSKLFFNNKTNIIKSNYNMVTIYVCSSDLIKLFPQHGIGKKHERPINLTEWQKSIIIPEELIKGLFHSDGTYYHSANRDYYQFKNYSKDILNIFKTYCDILGVNYTEQEKVINFYSRKNVNQLKQIIGTKTDIKL